MSNPKFKTLKEAYDYYNEKPHDTVSVGGMYFTRSFIVGLIDEILTDMKMIRMDMDTPSHKLVFVLNFLLEPPKE